MAYYPSDNPASLVGWFRKGIGVTVTGAGVSTWADQSGTGHDLLQATDTNRPSYDSGTGIITFDGVDNFLKATAFTWNQPEQLSILFSQISWTSDDIVADGNVTDRMALYQFSATPTIAIFAGSANVTTTGMPVDGTYHAVTSIFNGASSSLKVDANAAVTGNPGASNAGGFALGCRGSTGARFANIGVKEIILRNVDDATIRANDQQYLIDLQASVTPVSDFTGVPLSGTAPLSVVFTDTSTNTPFSWLWDFGDGNTSTLQNPTNNYALAGTYTVKLTATNYAGSNQVTKTDYISVSGVAAVVSPSVGNNTFWKKGHARIGQKREWRYWWEKDPCDIPEEIALSDDVEEVQAEANAVGSCITDMVMERATEETLKIMRAYYEVLQDQIIARQQTARLAADMQIIEAKRIEEKKVIRRKKIMLLLNG